MAEGTRERLLVLGRDLYLEVGPAGFSLREVARRAHLSAAAVYRHFDGKEALLGAVCDEGLRIFSGYLLRALNAPSPLERLRSAGDYYRRFAVENERDYRVLFMNDTGPDGEQQATSAPTFVFLVDRVRECVRAKTLARCNEVEAATVIWAHVHGLCSLRLVGQLAHLSDEAFVSLYRRSTDQLLASLA
jgi:AcrR family transcriptional regulator